MCHWKILFVVALGKFLASEVSEASETSLTNNNTSRRGHAHYRESTMFEAGSAEKNHRLAPVTYLFATSVSDISRGFLQSRSEARDENGQVKGEYSYMDGFYKVRVGYTAGSNGFRVIRFVNKCICLNKVKLMAMQLTQALKSLQNVSKFESIVTNGTKLTLDPKEVY